MCFIKLRNDLKWPEPPQIAPILGRIAMQPIATDGAGLSVCLSLTTVSPAKTAKPIEMPFGMRTRVSK